ncbi:S4 domain-containing protein, partial [Gluconobacter kondonii]|uniref:S4 domain-containing protein n=1 Tax=Gluconobacter kondonii TaxID=941463 RepID=UPI0022317C62
LVEAGLAKTNGEARRLVRGGGARLNNAVITDENRLIVEHDSVDGAIRLSAGKKHHVLVRVGS